MHLKKLLWSQIRSGGWAPILVLSTHFFLAYAVNAYELWPPVDIPMHFAGGMAIAFMVSQSFRTLPRESITRSRIVILELLLVVTLTATAAVCWELAEFTLDQIAGTNVQVGLTNTMKDLAVGMGGGIAIVILRGWQLKAGVSEIRELALDWARGLSA